jgi:defect in organelle trafficking protein DotA
MKWSWAVLLLLFSSASFAQMAGPFTVESFDASMQYLGTVFGQMGTLPVAPIGSTLFSELLMIMNKIVFMLGIIIVIYTALASTVQTAQEGEVMGKKWSIIFTPLRAAFGLMLMLPAPNSGYSFIQMTIMYLIVQGVGAANAIWEKVVDNLQYGETFQEKKSGKTSVNNLTDLIKNLLKSELCAYKINSDPEMVDRLNQKQIALYQVGNELVWTTGEGDPEICGKVEVPVAELRTLVNEIQTGISGLKLSTAPLESMFISMIEAQSVALTDIAREAYLVPDTLDRQEYENIRFIARNITTTFREMRLYYESYNKNKDEFWKNAREDGWIHAGSTYSKMLLDSGSRLTDRQYIVSFSAPSLVNLGLENSAITVWGAEFDSKASETLKLYSDTLSKDISTNTTIGSTKDLGTYNGRQIVYPAGFTSMQGSGALGDMFKGLAMTIVDSMTEDSTGDPLIALAKAGQTILTVTEIAFWISLVVIPLLALLSIPPCANPLWGVIGAIGFIIIAILMTVLPMLFSAGVMLGLYLPMVPWLLFTFCAIGWIILVVEAIIAAPLVALVFVTPAEDELGKAGHSIMILTGLIFRPALMIMGFVFAAKVMAISVTMLRFGFKELILANTGGIGLFGSIALIVIYVGIVTTIIHQSFSLIHVIPDKVMRWMGGSGDGEDVSGKLAKVRGSAETAGKVSGELMSGAQKGMQKMSSK